MTMTERMRAKHASGASVSHDQDGDHHWVGIADLMVLLAKTKHGWVAQGVQIDYAAFGDSERDAVDSFVQGLSFSLQSHLERFNELKKMLQPAPTEVLKELMESCPEKTASNISLRVELQDLAAISERMEIPPWERVQLPRAAVFQSLCA